MYVHVDLELGESAARKRKEKKKGAKRKTRAMLEAERRGPITFASLLEMAGDAGTLVSLSSTTPPQNTSRISWLSDLPGPHPQSIEGNCLPANQLICQIMKTLDTIIIAMRCRGRLVPEVTAEEKAHNSAKLVGGAGCIAGLCRLPYGRRRLFHLPGSSDLFK